MSETNSIPTSDLPDLLPHETFSDSNIESDSNVQNNSSSASVSVPFISPDSVDIIYDSSLAASVSVNTDATTEMIVQEVRPILTTPLNDYTVIEGLLLLILSVVFIRFIFSIFDIN